MPVGKVLWYDVKKGFGFVTNPGGEDCYVGRDVLPDGVTELHKGQKIDFDFVAGRRGPQALRVALVGEPPIKRSALHRYKPEELHGMVSDMITLMETRIQPDLRSGRWPERSVGGKVAGILRAIADELES